jgi:hypothetical protein
MKSEDIREVAQCLATVANHVTDQIFQGTVPLSYKLFPERDRLPASLVPFKTSITLRCSSVPPFRSSELISCAVKIFLAVLLC